MDHLGAVAGKVVTVALGEIGEGVAGDDARLAVLGEVEAVELVGAVGLVPGGVGHVSGAFDLDLGDEVVLRVEGLGSGDALEGEVVTEYEVGVVVLDVGDDGRSGAVDGERDLGESAHSVIPSV